MLEILQPMPYGGAFAKAEIGRLAGLRDTFFGVEF